MLLGEMRVETDHAYLQACDQRLSLTVDSLYCFPHFLLRNVAVAILVKDVERLMLHSANVSHKQIRNWASYEQLRQ